MPTVTVACKVPNGLILRLFNMAEHDEPVMGGGTKTVKKAVQTGEQVTVAGPATPFGVAPRYPIIGGYAMTPNVDADFFTAWLKQNADHDVVKKKLIFASEKVDSVAAKANDHESVLSGLQPLVPDDDKRIPRSSNPSLSPVKTMDTKAA